MEQGLKRRYLCWDGELIEKSENVTVNRHKPERRELALLCDGAWEGVHNCYGGIVRVGDTYRLYYRACHGKVCFDLPSGREPAVSVICVAESRDGIRFTKPSLGIYEYGGSKENNIVFMREDKLDNFSVFYDENPACPKDERFKALAKYYGERPQLQYYASEDGYHFRFVRFIDIKGTFDTYNVTFWDKKTAQYFLYYRNFHRPDGTPTLYEAKNELVNIRDVSVATSKDFLSWQDHGRIRFEKGQADIQLYTNQIGRYAREENTLIGFPVRYRYRVDGESSFCEMPMWERRSRVIERFGREGAALTDCTVMTSHDGFLFDRREEAFLTPGVEDAANWQYGDCYTVYGLVETTSDRVGAPDELSLYVGENYRIDNVNFRRYTVRLDGFFSWYADARGGEVLTRPLTVAGERLGLNFATSAISDLQVSICDLQGNPIEGYESAALFGNSTDRTVRFEKPLAALVGREVRLRFRLCDCDLYSFAFFE